MFDISSASSLKDWSEGGVTEVRGEVLDLIFRFSDNFDGKVYSLILIHSLLLLDSFVKEGLTLCCEFC